MQTCFLVGVAVVVVYLTMTSKRQYAGPMRHFEMPMHYATSMISKVGSAVSARVTTTLSSIGGDGSIDASEVYESIPEKKVHLIDCKSVKKHGKDGWKHYTDGEKEECHQNAIKWLKKHPRAIIMLFAPWCPHCHGQLEVIGQMASKYVQYPFVLINAEALPRAALMGESAIYPVQHFPTFLAKDGEHVKAASGFDDAIRLLDQISGAGAEKKKEEEVNESSPDESDPLAELFR